ncbi:MAG: xylulokinase, partial [Rhizobiaceae bacterium]|nr:xylulokinase [Rhizobiaceae bacterium]
MFLGIDLGLGSLKATLIDERGDLVAEATAAVTTEIARPNWSEQDPAGWEAALATGL